MRLQWSQFIGRNRAVVLAVVGVLALAGVYALTSGQTSGSSPAIRAAFYYPWYPETTFGRGDPSLGHYDSSDPAVIKTHVDEMIYADIDAGIASWWGQGTKTDGRLQQLLNASHGTSLQWTIYYEPSGQGNPSLSRITSDLNYLKRYTSDANWLYVNGKPVVFVYNTVAASCSQASTWRTAAQQTGFYVNLKVFPGYASCADQPDSWHQYGPAVPTVINLPYSYGVSPGFWHYADATPRLARDPARFRSNIVDQTRSGAQWQLITTFNEWGELSATEPGNTWGRRYLRIMNRNQLDNQLSPSGSPTTAPPPTTTTPPTSPPPSGSRVVVIWMENKENTAITANSAPYMTSFAQGGRNFTNFYGVTHPSLPNYLAFASGGTQGKVGTDSIRPGEIQAASLWDQLSNAGISWKVYEESMPSTSPPCQGNAYTGTNSGLYALKHNPATPFARVFTSNECQNVVPYTQFNAGNLPQVSFVTPNLCNDMHNCSVGTGDAWLKARVPAMLSSGATVLITFDEGSTGTNGGGHIWTAVDGPGIGSETNATTFNHYSALAGLEDRFGLPRLGAAAGRTPLPLSSGGPAAAGPTRGSGRSGVFSVKCTFSHRNSDDPIVFPGQPGAAHSHDFFGNKSVNASSTYASMRAAATTCRAKSDTAGYWIPTLLDPNNRPVTAAHMNVYYRGDAGTKTIPADLRMVAGATAGSPTGSDRVFWSCGQTDSNTHSPTMVNCPGDQLTLTVAFPSCWDGTLTHANDTTHVSYDAGCKSGVDLARVAINVKWDVQNATGYKLSSDAGLGTSRGRSAHADFWNTWAQSTLDSVIKRCLNGGIDCKNFTG